MPIATFAAGVVPVAMNITNDELLRQYERREKQAAKREPPPSPRQSPGQAAGAPR